MPIYEGMPEDQYFAIDAASNSGLKRVLQSPAHFKHCEPGDDDTRAKEIGRAIHCAILEPEKFNGIYVVADADKRTDARYRGLAADIGGHLVLTRPEHKKLIGMQSAAYRNSKFARLMKLAGRNELSVTSKDPATGVDVKCRFDRKGDGMWAFDLKKCQDARQNEFMRAISNYGYYMQIAFYAEVWRLETGERMNASRDFPLVAIEENAPHGCVLHYLDDVALEVGRLQFRRALDLHARCLERGEWPGYEDEEVINGITPWLADELADGILDGGE